MGVLLMGHVLRDNLQHFVLVIRPTQLGYYVMLRKDLLKSCSKLKVLFRRNDYSSHKLWGQDFNHSGYHLGYTDRFAS